MSIDTTAIGETAAALMDDLAKDYDDRPARVGIVAVIVEVLGEDADDRSTWTAVEYRCSDPRRWVQAGMFAAAAADAGA